MRYRIEGVDANTGKPAPPIEVDAPDERDAATLAKIRGVLATRITTITELLTVVKKTEPGTDGPQTKRTTLISIEGKPRWFFATVIVGLLFGALWLATSMERSPHRRADAPSRELPTHSTAAKLPKGLGWSLEYMEQRFSITDGWYWSGAQLSIATGEVEYFANSMNYPRTLVRVVGAPSDLHKFEIDVPVLMEEHVSIDDAALLVELICLRVNQMMDDPEGLLQWMADQMRAWARNPQTPRRTSSVFGTRSIECFMIVDEETVSMLLTVIPAE